MTFTPEKLAELKAVAEAATLGPWVWHTANSTNELVSLDERRRPARSIAHGQSERRSVNIQAWDQSHIATFDPPQVLALIEEIERLRDAIPRLVDALRCFLEDQRVEMAEIWAGEVLGSAGGGTNRNTGLH